VVYFFVILSVLLLLTLTFSYYFARKIISPEVYPYEEVRRLKIEEGVLIEEDWNRWQKEEIWIDSDFDYRLHGYWLPLEEAEGTVILVHGITVNHYASTNYVLPFRKRGFNVLLYDHRNHGKSGGKFTTFGQFEKYDLRSVVDWVIHRTGQLGIIGTHGESLGAATCLLHAAIDQRISFVVADCGYADLMELLYYRLKEEYKIPGLVILPVGSLMIRLIAKFWLQEINPVEAITAVETPIFLIHGAEDKYIPPIHAQQLFDAKVRGNRKLWFAPEAGHALSQTVNPAQYDQKIGEFLRENQIIS
jgi:fermentation-respiration switch protein FrsA (DUF1100 family)